VRKSLEDLVANVMTVQVVDGLDVVDVEDCEASQPARFRSRPSQCLFNPRNHKASVGNSRELVRKRLSGNG